MVTIIEDALAFRPENKLDEFYGGILILRVVGNGHAVNDRQALKDRVYRFKTLIVRLQLTYIIVTLETMSTF